MACLSVRTALAALLITLPLAAQGTSAADTRYFEAPRNWSLSWGSDAAVTLSNLERRSTNQVNDGSSNFDTLWLRLYGRLAKGEVLELIVDGFVSERTRPSLNGLYLRVQPREAFGVRVGQIPLVVGAWQDRAYPHRQPLINQPLSAQYLSALRNDAVAASADELWEQRGRGREARYALGRSGVGLATTLAYEHCWDTGIETFGRLGGVRYRVALTEGTPGAPAAKTRARKGGLTTQGRLTWQLTRGLRLGGSWARGPYLLDDVAPFLPPGRGLRAYRQRLWGADLLVRHGALELHGEWLRSRFDVPFIPAPGGLRADGLTAEVGYELWPGLKLAVRLSGLRYGDVDEVPGRARAWDAGATRLEAGLAYRMFDEHVALKGVVQRTEVALAPRRTEDVFALQVSFSR